MRWDEEAVYYFLRCTKEIYKSSLSLPFSLSINKVVPSSFSASQQLSIEVKFILETQKWVNSKEKKEK
jgi:hypothetical protein